MVVVIIKEVTEFELLVVTNYTHWRSQHIGGYWIKIS